MTMAQRPESYQQPRLRPETEEYHDYLDIDDYLTPVDPYSQSA